MCSTFHILFAILMLITVVSGYPRKIEWYMRRRVSWRLSTDMQHHNLLLTSRERHQVSAQLRYVSTKIHRYVAQEKVDQYSGLHVHLIFLMRESTHIWNVEYTCVCVCVCLLGKYVNTVRLCVDKKNQLDVTFCIIYLSSNSCSTCFGQPCAHHQELTTA